MREILFRAKDTDGMWQYGDFIAFNDEFCSIKERSLLRMVHICYTNTVCQCLGDNYIDKNGTLMFEGDIMQLNDGCYPCLVYWTGLGFAWLANGKRRKIDLTREKMTIIGNIFDNPELMERDEHNDT